MLNYKNLYSLLTHYLEHNDWSVDEQLSSDIAHLWVNKSLNESIQLPTKKGMQHFRAERTVKEAAENLADILNLSISDFIDKISIRRSDHIHIRAAGNAIEHGRINFRTNHKIESAIFSIIKTAANKFLSLPTLKKDKKKSIILTKTKAVEAYLSSVNIVAPTSGSFIYNLDVDLTKNDEFSETETLQRYVNTQLALVLNELHSMENIDSISTASLIQKGLSQSLCSEFIKLFDESIETIEYNFEWDESEPAPKLASNNLRFTKAHKEKANKLKDKFDSSEPIKLVDSYAQIINIKIKPEHAEIQLKVPINGSERSCDTHIDLHTAESLLSALGENIKQPVMVSATAWIEKSGQKHKYSLSDITSISAERGKNNSLLDSI